MLFRAIRIQFHSEMAKLLSASPREITSPFTGEIISVLHSKACNNLYIFNGSCWRASEVSETLSQVCSNRESGILYYSASEAKLTNRRENCFKFLKKVLKKV